jgi:hypothetical protein
MNDKHILSSYCFENVAIALSGLDSTIIIYQMVFNGINSHDVGLENLNSNSYTLKAMPCAVAIALSGLER